MGAFASPVRNRMVLPVDLPDRELQGLIQHELTHIFQYHLLSRGKLGAGLRGGQPQTPMATIRWFVLRNRYYMPACMDFHSTNWQSKKNCLRNS